MQWCVAVQACHRSSKHKQAQRAKEAAAAAAAAVCCCGGSCCCGVGSWLQTRHCCLRGQRSIRPSYPVAAAAAASSAPGASAVELAHRGVVWVARTDFTGAGVRRQPGAPRVCMCGLNVDGGSAYVYQTAQYLSSSSSIQSQLSAQASPDCCSCHRGQGYTLNHSLHAAQYTVLLVTVTHKRGAKRHVGASVGAQGSLHTVVTRTTAVQTTQRRWSSAAAKPLGMRIPLQQHMQPYGLQEVGRDQCNQRGGRRYRRAAEITSLQAYARECYCRHAVCECDCARPWWSVLRCCMRLRAEWLRCCSWR